MCIRGIKSQLYYVEVRKYFALTFSLNIYPQGNTLLLQVQKVDTVYDVLPSWQRLLNKHNINIDSIFLCRLYVERIQFASRIVCSLLQPNRIVNIIQTNKQTNLRTLSSRYECLLDTHIWGTLIAFTTAHN